MRMQPQHLAILSYIFLNQEKHKVISGNFGTLSAWRVTESLLIKYSQKLKF